MRKIDISFLAGFFLICTDLLARAAVQGVEQALVATAIEYGSAAMLCLSTWARAGAKLRFTNACNAIVDQTRGRSSRYDGNGGYADRISQMEDGRGGMEVTKNL
jgi:hypothetical protein